MAEEKKWEEADYVEEAKRIVKEYLSSMGWVRANKNTLYTELKPAYKREDEEVPLRALVQKEEDIEWKFGQDVDRWRKSEDKNRKIVLDRIIKELGHRSDLGFFGKRIVARLKRELIDPEIRR